MKRRPLGATIYGWTIIVCAGGPLLIHLFTTFIFWLAMHPKMDIDQVRVLSALSMNLALVEGVILSLGLSGLSPWVYTWVLKMLHGWLWLGLSLGLNLVGVVAGIGVLRLQSWGRVLALVLTAVALLLLIPAHPLWNVVWDILGGGGKYDMATMMTALGMWFFPLLFGVWTIWYFLRPGVKAQFVKAATSDK